MICTDILSIFSLARAPLVQGQHLIRFVVFYNDSSAVISAAIHFLIWRVDCCYVWYRPRHYLGPWGKERWFDLYFEIWIYCCLHYVMMTSAIGLHWTIHFAEQTLFYRFWISSKTICYHMHEWYSSILWSFIIKYIIWKILGTVWMWHIFQRIVIYYCSSYVMITWCY